MYHVSAQGVDERIINVQYYYYYYYSGKHLNIVYTVFEAVITVSRYALEHRLNWSLGCYNRIQVNTRTPFTLVSGLLYLSR